MVARIQENRFPFTKKDLERKKAPSPPTDFITYHDTHPKGKGLILRHYSKGRMSFAFRSRLNGRQYFFKIGDFPTTTVAQARSKVLDYRTQISQGKHPEKDRHSEAARITFGQMFDIYMSRHSLQKNRPTTIRDNRYQYKRYLQSKWANRRLASIRKSDILDLYFHIGENSGPYAANRVAAFLSSIFNKAISWGLFLKDNPAKIPTGDKYKEKKRERFLNREEIAVFLASLDEEPNTIVRDYFFLLLLSGARVSDGASIRWDDIDFVTRYWRIPDPKGGDTYTVPLVEPLWLMLVERLCNAMSQGYPGQWRRIRAISDPQEQKDKKEAFIKELNHIRIADQSPYVFPGTGRTGHFAGQKIAWDRIIRRAGLYSDDIEVRPRPHDLRRSMGSWQTIGGASLPIVGKSLGHKSPTATAIYARLNLDPVRESMENAASLMLGIDQKEKRNS